MATSLSTIKVALVNTTEPIDIQVTDGNGIPQDAVVLKLAIMDLGGNVMWIDDISLPGTLLVKPPTTVGYYYYPFGSIVPNTQTNSAQDYIFQWTVATATAQISTIIQNVKVVPAMIMYQLPYLRLMIDKSRKMVDPANDVFLGYTDANLIQFFESGLQIINGYQPETVMGFTFTTFPWQDYRHIALESALVAGTMSQQLFAVDTDLPNYSDQGTTFTISHQPQLAAFMNQISARLDKSIPAMKMQFVGTGSIHINAGPSYKLGQLLSAAPSGSTFRNVFFRP